MWLLLLVMRAFSYVMCACVCDRGSPCFPSVSHVSFSSNAMAASTGLAFRRCHHQTVECHCSESKG